MTEEFISQALSRNDFLDPGFPREDESLSGYAEDYWSFLTTGYEWLSTSLSGKWSTFASGDRNEPINGEANSKFITMLAGIQPDDSLSSVV